MLNSYVLGSTVRLQLSFTVNAALSTPTSTTIEVRAPDNSTQTPTLVSDGVGRFHADVTPTLAGPYSWYATGTGFAALPPSSAIAAEGAFYITPARTLTP